MKKQYSAPAIKARTIEGTSQILSASSIGSKTITSDLENAPVWGGSSEGGKAAGAKSGIWEDANDGFSE